MANELIIKNGYFSQGDSNITGSLLVSGSIGAYNSGSDVLSIYGSQGNLLVVTDSMSGSLFTITDISGYPILDVTSDDSVNIIGSLIVNDGTYNIVDTFNKVLNDANGDASVDWENKYLQVGGLIPLDWSNRLLQDSGDKSSIDWGARQLIANDGNTTHIDWSEPSYMQLPNISESSITNILGIDGSGRVYYTASSAIGGGGATFPYTGSAIISGSLTLQNQMILTGSMMLTGSITGSDVGGVATLTLGRSTSLTGPANGTIELTGLNGITLSGSTTIRGNITNNALTNSFAQYGLSQTYLPKYVLANNRSNGDYTSIAPPGDGIYPFSHVIARQANGATVTGTVVRTVSLSSSLSLGTLSTGSIYRIKALITKTGTAGTTTISVYNDDSVGGSSTNFLGQYTMAADQLYAQFERTLIVSSSGATIVFPTASSALTDVTASITASNVLPIIYRPPGGGVNQFITVNLQNSNTGDSSVVRYVTVETL